MYHDETKGVPGTNLCGHVLLFVPRRLTTRQSGGLFGDHQVERDTGGELLRELKRVRSSYFADASKFHFTEISGKKWTTYDRGTYEFLATGVEALQTRGSARFGAGLHCKVAAIFYPIDPTPALYGGDDRKERQYRYDETVLRMRLKGVLNGLYGPSHRVRVREIISDGVAAHRPLDLRRVLLQTLSDERVGRTALGGHVEIDPAVRVTPVDSDHKTHAPDSPGYDHAQLLQLADLFLGSFARAAYGTTSPLAVPARGTLIPKRKKDVVMSPVWELLAKQTDGRIFGSTHLGSFSASELVVINGAIHFRPLSVGPRAPKDGPGSQTSFSFSA